VIHRLKYIISSRSNFISIPGITKKKKKLLIDQQNTKCSDRAKKKAGELNNEVNCA